MAGQAVLTEGDRVRCHPVRADIPVAGLTPSLIEAANIFKVAIVTAKFGAIARKLMPGQRKPNCIMGKIRRVEQGQLRLGTAMLRVTVPAGRGGIGQQAGVQTAGKHDGSMTLQAASGHGCLAPGSNMTGGASTANLRMGINTAEGLNRILPAQCSRTEKYAPLGQPYAGNNQQSDQGRQPAPSRDAAQMFCFHVGHPNCQIWSVDRRYGFSQNCYGTQILKNVPKLKKMRVLVGLFQAQEVYGKINPINYSRIAQFWGAILQSESAQQGCVIDCGSDMDESRSEQGHANRYVDRMPQGQQATGNRQ